MIGKLLNNRYEIIELTGKGGMSLVYKAKDKLLNRYVAVKVLKEEFVENEQFIKKFNRESQAAASLSHPNIVNVFDVGSEDNINYIVMEFIDGMTLKHDLMLKEKFESEEATKIVRDIALALSHAHKNKIIHRDVKPHNILMTKEEVPKVADFGIARAITSSTVTMTGETMGSVHYISPEQARGGFVDERSDLYSLGIVYYELLSGKVPFDGENSVTIAIQHIQNEITPIKEIEPSISDDINYVVMKLIKKQPEERYQSADALVDDLNRILDGLPLNKTEEYDDGEAVIVSAEENEIAATETKKKLSKKQKIIIGSITGVFSLLIIGAIIFNAFMTVPEVEVPDVIGLSYDEAVKVIEEAGLEVVKQTENNSEVEKDYIISQTPKAEKVVKEGSEVTLVVSLGTEKVNVPDIIGMTEADGKEALDEANLKVKTVREYNNDYEAGIIYDVSPAVDTELDVNTEITIYISEGSNIVEVPDLVGTTETEAQNAIINAGLTLGQVTTEASNTYDQGIVSSQSITAGQEVEMNTVINIVVSEGKITTQTISIDLANYTSYNPAQQVEVLVLSDDNDQVYSGTHMSDDSFSFTVTGYGDKTYQVYIDDQPSGTPISVTF
jgi:serine/threonine-protein kinase